MSWSKKWSAGGHSAPVYSCCADDDYVYSSSGDKFVTRWHISSGIQDAFAIKLDSPAYVIGLSEKAQLLIIGCSNGTIVAIDKNSKKLLWEYNYRGNALFSFVDCSHQSFFLLGDGEGELLVISYEGKLIAGFPLACGKIRQMRLTGNSVFLACQDGDIRRIDLPSFNEMQRFKAHEGGVNAMVVFPDSHTLISGGRDAHLRVWDLVTEKELHAVPAHYQTIYGIEKCRINEIISVSMDKTIKFWDIQEMKVTQRIEFRQGGHNRSVNGCISSIGNEIITFSDDKLVNCWISD